MVFSVPGWLVYCVKVARPIESKHTVLYALIQTHKIKLFIILKCTAQAACTAYKNSASSMQLHKYTLL
jgi:hypothetical protein